MKPNYSSAVSCCIICYKKFCLDSDNPNHHDNLLSEDGKELLKRFFKLFGRCVMEPENCLKTDSSLMEKLIESEFMGACGDCFKIVESFCSLFHDMKVIELLLQWKVVTLKNIMFCANRVPLRIASLNETMNQQVLDTGGVHDADGVKSFLAVKSRLMRKCNERLLDSYPKVHLKRQPQTLEEAISSPPSPVYSVGDDDGDQEMEIELPKTRSHQKKEDKNYESFPTEDRNRKLNDDGIGVSCDLCSNRYRNARILKAHKEAIHQGLIYKCRYCGFTKTQKGVVRMHSRENHKSENGNPLPYKIKIINENTKESGNMRFKTGKTKRGKGYHRQIQDYSCDLCGKKFSQMKTLRIHKESVHEGRKYKCGYCGVSRSQEPLLRMHSRQSHRDSKGVLLPYKISVIEGDNKESSKKNVVVITLVKGSSVEQNEQIINRENQTKANISKTEKDGFEETLVEEVAGPVEPVSDQVQEGTEINKVSSPDNLIKEIKMERTNEEMKVFGSPSQYS